MVNSPEQFLQIHKAAMDTFQAVALKSFEGFEKLAELNAQAAKASFEESSEQLKAVQEELGDGEGLELGVGLHQDGAVGANGHGGAQRFLALGVAAGDGDDFRCNAFFF